MEPQHIIVTALILRGHMRLQLAGLKHSKLSGKTLLDHATQITGNAYKRGQYQAALEDLNAVINTHKETHT